MAGHAGPPVGPASDVVLPLHSLKKRGVLPSCNQIISFSQCNSECLVDVVFAVAEEHVLRSSAVHRLHDKITTD